MKNDQWPSLLREAEAEVEGAKECLFAALHTELHQLTERQLRRSARDSISPTTLLGKARALLFHEMTDVYPL